MRKRLVFRVDDCGYTEAYDLGIKKAFTEGIGCSADVMFDAKHTPEFLQWVKERPWISVGWHRHLWESPVLPAEEVPSLVDEEGRFKWRHRHPELMKEVNYDEAVKEFEAQLELCKKYLGRYPDVAGFLRGEDNPLERAFRDVVIKHNLPHNYFTSQPGAGGKVRSVADKEWEDLNFISVNIQPDPSVGFRLEYFKDYNPLEKMMSPVWTDKEEIYFYGWHPGYCDDYIMKESTCNLHRCKELEACCSPVLRKWIIDNHIELINMADAIHGTNHFQDHLKEINSDLWIGNMK